MLIVITTYSYCGNEIACRWNETLCFQKRHKYVVGATYYLVVTRYLFCANDITSSFSM